MNKDRSWHEQGLCAGHPTPDIWHYENSTIQDEQQLAVLNSIEAIQICNECPVKAQCLEQGMEAENLVYNGGSGTIWGGLMNSERFVLKTGHIGSKRMQSEARHRTNVRQVIGRIS